jgi:hypothetical protein
MTIKLKVITGKGTTIIVLLVIAAITIGLGRAAYQRPCLLAFRCRNLFQRELFVSSGEGFRCCWRTGIDPRKSKYGFEQQLSSVFCSRLLLRLRDAGKQFATPLAFRRI